MVTAQARPTVVPPSDSVGSSQSSLTVQSVHTRYNTSDWHKQKAPQKCKKTFFVFYFCVFFLFVCTSAPLSSNSLVSSHPTYRSADAGVEQSQGPGAPSQGPRGPGSRQQQGPPHPYEGYYQVGCIARSLTLFTTSRTNSILSWDEKGLYNILVTAS